MQFPKQLTDAEIENASIDELKAYYEALKTGQVGTMDQNNPSDQGTDDEPTPPQSGETDGADTTEPATGEDDTDDLPSSKGVKKLLSQRNEYKAKTLELESKLAEYKAKEEEYSSKESTLLQGRDDDNAFETDEKLIDLKIDKRLADYDKQNLHKQSINEVSKMYGLSDMSDQISQMKSESPNLSYEECAIIVGQRNGKTEDVLLRTADEATLNKLYGSNIGMIGSSKGATAGKSYDNMSASELKAEAQKKYQPNS